jgi:hypothetical protein
MGMPNKTQRGGGAMWGMYRANSRATHVQCLVWILEFLVSWIFGAESAFRNGSGFSDNLPEIGAKKSFLKNNCAKTGFLKKIMRRVKTQWDLPTAVLASKTRPTLFERSKSDHYIPRSPPFSKKNAQRTKQMQILDLCRVLSRQSIMSFWWYQFVVNMVILFCWVALSSTRVVTCSFLWQ